MPPFRPSFRLTRALELSRSSPAQRTLHPSFFTARSTPAPRYLSDKPPKPLSDGSPRPEDDPLEEWRNPKPSKWPNRIRLLMLPFLGAVIYSMVLLDLFLLYCVLSFDAKLTISLVYRRHQNRIPHHRRERLHSQAREWHLVAISHASPHGTIHKTAPKTHRCRA